MRAIIVDDEQSNLENLSFLLQKHCPLVEIVGLSSNVESAANLIDTHLPDLVFLDIQLGKQTAFDLLNTISKISFEVIFVTAYDHYGIQAIKFAALDYLLKPIDVEELVLAVNKAVSKFHSKSRTEQLEVLLQHVNKPAPNRAKIALPQQHEIRYISIHEIVRCEADSSYTMFILANGEKILTSKPLKEYAELLNTYQFIRTHQSHLINPAFVKSWLKEDGGVLLLNTGEKIPVSKINKERVKHSLSLV